MPLALASPTGATLQGACRLPAGYRPAREIASWGTHRCGASAPVYSPTFVRCVSFFLARSPCFSRRAPAVASGRASSGRWQCRARCGPCWPRHPARRSSRKRICSAGGPGAVMEFTTCAGRPDCTRYVMQVSLCGGPNQASPTGPARGLESVRAAATPRAGAAIMRGSVAPGCGPVCDRRLRPPGPAPTPGVPSGGCARPQRGR